MAEHRANKLRCVLSLNELHSTILVVVRCCSRVKLRIMIFSDLFGKSRICVEEVTYGGPQPFWKIGGWLL